MLYRSPDPPSSVGGLLQEGSEAGERREMWEGGKMGKRRWKEGRRDGEMEGSCEGGNRGEGGEGGGGGGGDVVFK
jgi:hypothetical protein